MLLHHQFLSTQGHVPADEWHTAAHSQAAVQIFCWLKQATTHSVTLTYTLVLLDGSEVNAII